MTVKIFKNQEVDGGGFCIQEMLLLKYVSSYKVILAHSDL